MLRSLGIAVLLAVSDSLPAEAEVAPCIVLMMADDLGFSDLGCYGGEIATPHLDQLARQGVRFANFSNTSRCCPSRASLLTGLYSHQAGIGRMNGRDEGPGYRGQLLNAVPTLPELLSKRGYSTAMVGKWHLTRSSSIDNGPNGSWPRQRGFEFFYGTMEGAKNYFAPTWLFDNGQEVRSFKKEFFYTDAISTRAAQWIRTQPVDQPLFLYTAFYAPHFPLQAPRSAIQPYRGKYLAGWDQLREQRFARQKELGIIPARTKLSQRPGEVPAWQSLDEEKRAELDLRMATYAAQVHLLDQGAGRIITALQESGRWENSLVIFLSDNGAASTGGAFGAGPAATVGKRDAPVRNNVRQGLGNPVKYAVSVSQSQHA